MARADSRAATDSHVNYDRIVSVVSSATYRLLIYATILFLLSPLVIVVILSLKESAYGGWPPQGFSPKWYLQIPERVGYLGVTEAAINSVKIAVVTAVVSTTIGALAAFALDRYELRYATAVETLLLSPLIYPWIVVGIAILLLIGRLNGMLENNIELSIWTVLLGHIIVTLPYPTRTVLANLANFEYSLEEAARDLGATEVETYTKITLPLIQPGILSGLVFAFILSWNNYIVTLFLTSTDTQTIPLVLFALFKNSPPTLLAAIATVVMIGIMMIVTVAEFTVGISEYL